MEPGLGDRLTDWGLQTLGQTLLLGFQNDRSLLPEKPSVVMPEIPQQLPGT